MDMHMHKAKCPKYLMVFLILVALLSTGGALLPDASPASRVNAGVRPAALAATAPGMGTARSFAVLAGSTATNTGFTTLNGNLGVWPGTAYTGFPPGTVNNGSIYAGDAVAAQAQADAGAAYNALASQACDTYLSGQNLGGLVLLPGVYCFTSSAALTGQLVLDAEGDSGAVWVFKIGSSLTAAGSVSMINGGSECNVYWQVGESATLGTSTAFAGTIIALTSITLNSGASMYGSALARNGAVTMDTNNIQACATGVLPTATSDAAATATSEAAATATSEAAATATSEAAATATSEVIATATSDAAATATSEVIATATNDAIATQTPTPQDSGLIVYPPLPWHDPICSGHRQRYTLRFANNTTQTLTNVRVSNLLPDICPGRCDVCLWDGGWPHDDCSPGAMYDGQRTVTWLLPSVAPGEMVTLYLEMRVWSVVPGGQVLENCLTVSSDQTEPQTACSHSTTLDCETPVPTSTATATATATATRTATPTSTPTPTPTMTPMPTEQCYSSAPDGALIYRISAADFYGYYTDSASTSELIAVTSPPAPAGWNEPGFVPDDSWRSGIEVWWDAWAESGWWIYPDASIVGLPDEHGVQEGLDGITHLIRHTFQVDAPHPDLRITHAILQMWSDNKTAWWWEGEMIVDTHEGSGGQVDLFPGEHIAPDGGTYVLAIQNSNDMMYGENPHGTAFRLCVTWVHVDDIAATPTPTDTAMPTATPTLTATAAPQRVLLPLVMMGY